MVFPGTQDNAYMSVSPAKGNIMHLTLIFTDIQSTLLVIDLTLCVLPLIIFILFYLNPAKVSSMLLELKMSPGCFYSKQCSALTHTKNVYTGC